MVSERERPYAATDADNSTILFRVRPLMSTVRWTTTPVPSRHGRADLDAEAPVGHDDRADEEARLLRRQEHDHLGDLLGPRRAADRRVLPMVGQELPPVRHEIVEQVGDDVA